MKAAQLFQIAPIHADTENEKVDVKGLQDLLAIREEVSAYSRAPKRKMFPATRNILSMCTKVRTALRRRSPYLARIASRSMSTRPVLHYSNPLGSGPVAIDGETQLAARHEAANLEPATKQDFVPVYICHGRDAHWARQAFHDLNTLGVKPNAALSIGMDARDPITKICREVERRVPFFSDRVNKARRQLRGSDLETVTITTLRGACVTLAKGINGVSMVRGQYLSMMWTFR